MCKKREIGKGCERMREEGVVREREKEKVSEQKSTVKKKNRKSGGNNQDRWRSQTRINVRFSALIRGSGCVGGQRFGGLKLKLQPRGSMWRESGCVCVGL